MSKLWGHLQTKHGKQPVNYKYLGEDKGFINPSFGWNGYCLLSKVNNFEFIVNWASYDANAKMV